MLSGRREFGQDQGLPVAELIAAGDFVPGHRAALGDESMSVTSGRLVRMIPWTLADIERAIRSSWGEDTCAPEDLPNWHPGNPARGQCGVTALVLNDLLGGDLVRGEVHANGKWTDFHWWNRFAEGVEIDLTREQFTSQEIVTSAVIVKRPPTINRLREEYELLRSRVYAGLDIN